MNSNRAVFLVDDDLDHLSTITRGLTRYCKWAKNAKIIECASIDAAVSCFEAQEFQVSLWILDIMMPFGEKFNRLETKDGLETGLRFLEWMGEQLKSDKPSKKNRILVVTNEASAVTAASPEKWDHLLDVKIKYECTPKRMSVLIDHFGENALI